MSSTEEQLTYMYSFTDAPHKYSVTAENNLLCIHKGNLGSVWYVW